MAGSEASLANGTAMNGGGQLVAVGKVVNSLPAPDFAGLTIESQTNAIGLIHPPPDIRAIVDKTAQFVAKNGPEFEKRILANERENVKFNFLKSTDPYHAYYQYRVEEFKAGEAGAPVATPAQQAAQAEALQEASKPALAVPPTKLLVEPAATVYTVPVPDGLRLMDLDIMKLTAQFVARNGKSFMTDLAAHQSRTLNHEFNFLKPTHSLYGFFTALCDAFSRVLMPPAGTVAALKRDATDREGILERCLGRLEWEKVKETEAKKEAAIKEAERVATQSIDWHDFVVVETIDFFDEEEGELPPPMSLRELIALNKAAALEEEDEAAAGNGIPTDMQVEMDATEKELISDAAAAAKPAPPQPPLPSEPPAVPPPVQGGGAMREADEPEEIRLVRGYQRQDPRVLAAQVAAHKMVLSPITGELVPVDQMAEHLRISLIDPRWKLQRDSMLAKIRETTKASDDEISRNLVGLAKSRPDVFGSTQDEVSLLVQESLRESDITGVNRAVAWDGSTMGGDQLRNQIQAINSQKLGAGQAASLPPPPAARPGPQAGPAGYGAPAALPPRPVTLAPPPRPSAPPPAASLPVASAAAPTGSLPAPPPVARASMAPPPMMPPPGTMRPPPMMPPPSMPPPPGVPGGLPQPPMGAGPGAPMPPPPRSAPPMGEEPDAKRQRLDFKLQPEDEFLEAYPGGSKVRVQAPDVDDSDTLNGQVLELEVTALTDSVGDLKTRLAEVLGLPANKMKISRDGVGVVKDHFSLAFYNVSPDITLLLGTRERGGGRKK